MNFDKEIDLRGLNCPLPIVKTKKQLGELGSGQVLKVVTSDPGSMRDMVAFTKATRNELLSSEEVNSEYVFFIRKS
ncbi:Sulfur carrier protein TusA [Burkholderiales bacterium]|nr:MAG: sulfurtransferase TusA family protein [Burkholderiales bacterium]CAG0950287.1 Sulfur carrier protein TusA [Burkholderiales bacterium]